MGLIISRLTKFLLELGVVNSRILMLGLDGVGKTTILYKLKLNATITTNPTIGFNIEEVQVKGLCFSVWDIGGQDNMRRFWRHHLQGNDGFIFVVDSTDRKRMEEASHEFHNVMRDGDMRDMPILVFANKQDLPNAMPTSQLVDALQLQTFRRNKWHIQSSNAITGDGLYEGLEQLALMMRQARAQQCIPQRFHEQSMVQ